MQQVMATSALPFEGAAADNVDALLDKFAPRLRNQGDLRTTLRDSGIHFMSITVVRGDAGEKAHLLVEISADTDRGDAYDIVEKKIAHEVTSILVAAWIETGQGVAQLLRRHRVRTGQGLFQTPGLDFCGTPGLTVERIKQEARLARFIRDILDRNPRYDTPLALLGMVRGKVKGRSDLEPLGKLAPEVPRLETRGRDDIDLAYGIKLLGLALLKFGWPLLTVLGAAIVALTAWAGWATGWLGGFITFVVSFIIAVFVVAGAAYVLYRKLQDLEEGRVKEEAPVDGAPCPEVMVQIAAHEDWAQQNHLAAISRLKPGLIRALTLRLALWVVGRMAADRYRPGFLADLGTIHFARWVQVPGTDKLLFFSNYGGSWQSYLEDFITKASAGLTGVWSNTKGFPRARNLFLEGATDGDRFKRWARRQQQPSRFWYTAYPDLTTARIRINASIRQGLCQVRTEDEATVWLGLFGSKVRPADLIEMEEVQTLLFGGLGRHPHAACLALRLPVDPEQARSWLAGVEGQVTFGEEPPKDRALVLGLSSGGLKRLGLPEEVAGRFPDAFRLGMGCKARSDILADTGDDNPTTWLWGRHGDEADAVLLVYSDDATKLASEVAHHKGALHAAGGRVIHEVTPTPLQAGPHRVTPKEAFGFADGVSQPIVRGTRRWMRQSDKIHTVEPGEFILGYPDSRGFVPPTPTVAAALDPAQVLPLADPQHTRGNMLPYFSGKAETAERDFGRNGTFLVIRQLEQDVGAFNRFVADAATRYKNHPAVPPALTPPEMEEWLGAKMVGRWKNGNSLVRFPHGPDKARERPDNEFLYGDEDPIGERCPLGSHIRRANPRDSLSPGSPDAIRIVNRHRILRVGRNYPPEGSGDRLARNPGLLFMCLNADIERQFEFVQQTWIMGRQFHGLENEVDPIMGRGHKMGRLTIPSRRGPMHVTGIQDFIRVRGGGYFFMPGRRALRWLAHRAHPVVTASVGTPARAVQPGAA